MQAKGNITVSFVLAALSLLFLGQPRLVSIAFGQRAGAQELSGKALNAQSPEVQLKEVTLAISGMR